MKHRISADDAAFRDALESLALTAPQFDHAAHVRLAYIYLCEHDVETAAARMKRALLAFLAHLGADPSKYHETLTRAWILAVDHFMSRAAPSASYAEFVAQSAPLLDSKIMLTHYSAELLFSPAARAAYAQPDLQAIPPDGPDGPRAAPGTGIKQTLR